MPILLSIPIMALAVILQSSLFSRITLLNGTADLVLLIVASWSLREQVQDEWIIALVAGLLVGFVSAIPIWAPIAAYLGVAWLAAYIKRRIWQIPILSLFSLITAGSVLSHAFSYLALLVSGISLPIGETINLIVLPGLLLNLLLAIPVNGLVGEITGWLYPQAVEA